MPVSRETITLPLFLVEAVLFPGTRIQIALHDERHGRVVQECAEHDTPIGVVLGRRGESGPPEPSSVGTIARVLETEAQSGTVVATVVGISRFALLSYRQGARVFIGQGRFLPDADDSVPRVLTDESYALASEYVSWARLDVTPREVPGDPEALSYWIARYLPLSLDQQQSILEQRSLGQRLADEIGYLREILDAARMPRVR